MDLVGSFIVALKRGPVPLLALTHRPMDANHQLPQPSFALIRAECLLIAVARSHAEQIPRKSHLNR